MLIPKETYGLLVIGRQKSAVGYVKGNHIEVVREFNSGIHSKHRASGQSQRRFERLMKEGEKQFYKRISEEINELFLSMEDLRGIFIGGPGPSKEKFVNDESLDYRLREKILDVVDLGYGGIEGIRALIDKVKDKIYILDVKYIREKQKPVVETKVQEETKPEVKEPVKISIKHCPFCGIEVNETQTFCMQCGMRLLK